MCKDCIHIHLLYSHGLLPRVHGMYVVLQASSPSLHTRTISTHCGFVHMASACECGSEHFTVYLL